NHSANVSEAVIRTNTLRCGRGSQPDLSSAALHPQGERTIVNYFLPDSFDAAGLLQRIGAYQDASSSSACRATPGILNPGWWIEFKEKIDKGRDEKLFRHRPAVKFHHV